MQGNGVGKEELLVPTQTANIQPQGSNPERLCAPSPPPDL